MHDLIARPATLNNIIKNHFLEISSGVAALLIDKISLVDADLRELGAEDEFSVGQVPCQSINVEVMLAKNHSSSCEGKLPTLPFNQSINLIYFITRT